MSLAELTGKLGALLGPEPMAEIVITLYESDTPGAEDKRINFQIEGMQGPVPPQLAYRMLEIVAQQLVVQIPAPPQQEAPST